MAPLEQQNHAAHEGVRFEETCSCGARRSILVNGVHIEKGDWTMEGEKDV